MGKMVPSCWQLQYLGSISSNDLVIGVVGSPLDELLNDICGASYGPLVMEIQSTGGPTMGCGVCRSSIELLLRSDAPVARGTGSTEAATQQTKSRKTQYDRCNLIVV